MSVPAPNQPRILGPGDGDLMGDPAGVQDRFMVGVRDTDGRLAVVEHILAPHCLAAPVHRHSREDEYTYVLEGEIGAILGRHEVVVRAGEFLFKPRDQWHTFWNAGTSTARVLEIISPAGIDELFRELDALDGWPEPETLIRMAGAYGCDLDFDATLPLVERHGLSF